MLTKTEITHYLAVGILRDKLSINFERFVSTCPKAIPRSGSPTAPLSSMNELETFKHMSGIVMHKDGGFTIKTSIVNIRFWPSTFAKDYALALEQGPSVVAGLRAAL